jgi:hypothetical protein
LLIIQSCLLKVRCFSPSFPFPVPTSPVSLGNVFSSLHLSTFFGNRHCSLDLKCCMNYQKKVKYKVRKTPRTKNLFAKKKFTYKGCSCLKTWIRIDDNLFKNPLATMNTESIIASLIDWAASREIQIAVYHRAQPPAFLDIRPLLNANESDSAGAGILVTLEAVAHSGAHLGFWIPSSLKKGTWNSQGEDDSEIGIGWIPEFGDEGSLIRFIDRTTDAFFLCGARLFSPQKAETPSD